MSAITTYDAVDRQATLTVEWPGEPDLDIVTASSYEPTGPLASVVLGNGLTETRLFDTRYFPDAIQVGGGSPVLDWQYTTDDAGNVTAIADALDPANDRVYGYEDYQYYLTQGDGPRGDLSWTYDRIGNRLSETRDGVTDVYDYLLNGAGGHSAQLDQIALGAGGIQTFDYDDAGNQTQVDTGGDVVDRTYDDAGRMSRQERASAGASTDFLYDGRSYLRRATGVAPDPLAGVFCDGFESGDTSAWDTGIGPCPPTVGLLVSEPTYSSEGVLHRVGNVGKASYVFYFGGRPVAQLSAGDLTYLTVDHIGTPILASGEAASVEWEGGFEPFGTDYSGASKNSIFLRFPGQWEEDPWANSGSEEGLYNNLLRWHLPSVGIFSKADPAGLILGGINPFVYAKQSPLRYADPLGLTTCVVISGVKVTEMFSYEFHFGDHASVFVTGSCSGNDSGCTSPSPMLYDPNGGYPQQFSDSGHSYILDENIEGWSLGDYFDYQCNAGSDILEIYCFNTSCCEEEEIDDRIGAGGTGLMGCSTWTTAAVNTVGPFGKLGSGLTPALLRRAVNRALRKSHGGGTLTRLRCPGPRQ